ncbi:MAG: hypothetical protein AB9919_00955 [Geobacteraceae bacterium]|jgi:hypothetical protein
MKNTAMLVGVAMIAGFALAGCANSREQLVQSSRITGNEVSSGTAVSKTEPGMATVDFSFSVKSNAARFAWMSFKHGNPPYRVQVTLDGNTTTLYAEPKWDTGGPLPANVAERGAGWKYQFSTRFAVAPGSHKLSIALPLDQVLVERTIEVRAGENAIIVHPVYKKKLLRPYKGHNFSAGVDTLEVCVRAADGSLLQQTCAL